MSNYGGSLNMNLDGDENKHIKMKNWILNNLTILVLIICCNIFLPMKGWEGWIMFLAVSTANILETYHREKNKTNP
mgnify:CR=1 FL=1